jgi:hypothetical protein
MGDILHKAKGFLGVPGNAPYNKAQHYETELQTYPEQFTDALINMGFVGSKDNPIDNKHVAQVILEKTNAHQCYPITRCAPWEEHSSSLTFTWSSMRFTQHVLDKLPELAMARLVSRTATSGSASMARYGIAMLLEATFMTTALGKRTYTMIIEQMKIATITTANTMILVAILTHKPYESEGLEGIADQDSPTSAVGINKMLLKEKQMTAIMNKTGGSDKLLREMQNILRTRGVHNANFTIIPQGSAKTFSRDSTQFANIMTDETDESVERSKSMNMTIIESEPRSQGHGVPFWDPYMRRRAYGGYFTLDSEGLTNEKPLNYRTNMRDKMVYDENGDCFRMASYNDYARYTGLYRWDESDMPLTAQNDEIGHGWVRDMEVNTWGQANRKYMHPHWNRHLCDIIRARCNTPQTKRAFLKCLRLLPKDSKQVLIRGDFPEEDEFKLQDVLDLCGPDAQLDTTFNVDDYRDALHNRGDPNNPRTQAVKRSLEKRMREETDPTFEELFDMNPTYDRGQSKQQDPYYERDGDVVMKVTGTTVDRREIRKKFRSARPADAQMSVRKEMIRAKEEVTKDGKTKNYCGVWPDAIDSAPGIGDEGRMQMYKDLKQCIEGAKAFIKQSEEDPALFLQSHGIEGKPAMGGAPADVIDAAIVTCTDVLMSRLCGATDVERAVKSTVPDRNKQTPLEQQSLDEGNLVTHPTAKAREYLKWNVEGSLDEGQVALTDRLSTDTFKQSLPYDAYAASLAAPGKVAILSESSEMSLFQKLTAFDAKTPVRADRRTALQWSICVSHLFHQLQQDADSMWSPSMTAAQELAASLLSMIDNCLERGLLAADATKGKLKQNLSAYGGKHSKKCLLPLSQAPFKSAVQLIQQVLMMLIGRVESDFTEEELHLIDDLRQEFREHITRPDKDASDRPFEPYLEVMELSHVDEAVREMLKELKATDPDADASAMHEKPAMMDMSQAHWTNDFIQDCIDRHSIAFGGPWKFCNEFDVPFHHNLECHRPRKVYMMGSAHMQVADSTQGAANTYFQMPHMMMGADPGPKLVYGNYTCYFAPVIMHPQRIVVMPDVYVAEYIGGNGLDVNDPTNPDHVVAWSAGRGASVFVIAVPEMHFYNHSHPWKYITGQLPAHIPGDPEVVEALRYPGCDAFTRFWSFTGPMMKPSDKSHVVNPNPRELSQNTLCFQDFQVGWDVSKQDYVKYKLNEGHFGKYACYPGAADVTNGRRAHFDDKPAYYNASAGA